MKQPRSSGMRKTHVFSHKNNYKGAIFDVDGTLLDSMQAWDTVAADYLKSRGVTPNQNLNREISTLGGHEIPKYFQVEYGIHESVDSMQTAINGLLEDCYFKTAQLKEGAADVLEALYVRGVKMCVATATDRVLVESALQRCGILSYFLRVFTCGEEKTSKSSPDIYIRAADFMGTDIADTLVFEDALYAIKSAKKAGFPVVGVYDFSAEDQQGEIKNLCDYYFTSLIYFK